MWLQLFTDNRQGIDLVYMGQDYITSIHKIVACIDIKITTLKLPVVMYVLK